MQTLPQLPQGEATQSGDSTSAIDVLGDQVGEVGELVVEGRWSEAWNETVAAFGRWAVDIAPNLLRALFVGLLFYGLYRLIYGFAARILKRSERASAGLGDLALDTLRALGLVFVGVIVLSQVGVNVTAAVAGLGIAGLALGFAAKDTLENFIAGVTILLDRPFSVGDTVEVEGVYGRVSRFTLRSTRIRTLDRRILVMPNVRMINQKLINHSAIVPLRVEVPFGIAYKESIDEARSVVLDQVEEDDRFDDAHDPKVVVTEMAASSVNMALWLFVREAVNEVPIRLEYTERIRKALAKADIEVPFPHMQVFVDGADGLQDLRIFQAPGNGASGPKDSGASRPGDGTDGALADSGEDGRADEA